MAIIIENFDKPTTCIECPFLSKREEFYEGNGYYKKVAFCTLHPEPEDDEDLDIYRDAHYFVNNIEPWCPIKDMKEDEK